MKKQYLLSALTLALLANLGHAAEGAGATAAKNTAKSSQMLSSGIATQYIDPSVRAQDDLYEHLNGKWLKTVEIPADKSRWGSFSELQENTLPQLRGIIEKASASNPGKGTDA
ncbi:MAG TPA: M13 family peptidase, partial [Telluria sp.]